MFQAFAPRRTSAAAPAGLFQSFSTRLLPWVWLVALSLLVGCASSPEPEAEAEPEPEPEETETFVEEPAEFEPAERAPREYTVKRGDTLWDISSMFLRDPWLWPEIWHINPQIRNPHLIYPGDVIRLFWRDGQAQLEIERDGEVWQTTLDVQRLSPRVRTEPLPDAVPYLPADAILPLLRQPQLITEEMMEDAPYLLRSRDGRLMTGAGDQIYVRGMDDNPAERHTLLRPGEVYRDPESGRVLGREAIFIGEAEFMRGGDPATLFLTRAVREAREGDLLFPIEQRALNRDFYPRAPEEEIDGQVIAALEEGELIGQYQTVVINRGSKHGLEPGHVVNIQQRGERVRDQQQGFFGESVKLPDEEIGLALLYRIEEEVSFGLVMTALQEISKGDMVRNPRDRIRTPQTREPRSN